MNRYILHGGITSRDCESNRQFFNLMARDIPTGGIWLGIYFARADLNKEREIFERDVAQFKKFVPERHDINFIMADKQTWHNDIINASSVFIAGGDTQKLQNTLMEIPNYRELFMLNKTYAGSSAGMYVLGRDSLDTLKDGGELVCLESMNILPYGMVAHYGAPEYYISQANLATRKRPLLMLAETQFVVIEQ
jgi:peptidase E